jgi:uncharacterized protein involved in exopolysaccharide biosynthesis
MYHPVQFETCGGEPNVEEEIDLRPYIEALLNKWKWIVSAVIVAALGTFIAMSLIPETYSATAVVAVIGTGDIVQLDEGIIAAEEKPLTALPELALSNEMLAQVIAKLPDNQISMPEFEKSLNAEAGGDKSLIWLTASSQTPEIAAQTVNIWAEIYIEWANRLYAGQGNERLAFFETQLSSTAQYLADAESAIETYQAINQSQIISHTLVIYQDNYNTLLYQQERTLQLLENAKALQIQLLNSTLAGNSYTDQLTYLQLQLQTFNNDSALPIIIDINTQDVLTTVDRDDQLAILDGLIRTLETKSVTIYNRIEEMEPEILQLQQERQIAQTEYSKLMRNVAIAEQAYISLAFQVEEERITSQNSNSGFRLASRASIPSEPDSRGRLIGIIIASTVGGLFAIFAIFVIEWWQNQKNETVEP